jgi:hypothetical protein
VKLTKAFCLELAMGRNLAELSAQLAREEQRTQALTARMALVETRLAELSNPWINPKHWVDSDI